MSEKLWLKLATTSVLSGVVGLVYGWNSLSRPNDIALWLLNGAVLGLLSGGVYQLMSKAMLWARAAERQSLLVNLTLGVAAGLLIALAYGSDLLLGAMVGEVGALLLSSDAAEYDIA